MYCLISKKDMYGNYGKKAEKDSAEGLPGE
jgi:hypothetical protein